MTPVLVLHGYPPSVYTRTARLVLLEKDAPHRLVAIDPFANEAAVHPFGRVPVLDHDGFRVFETVAIARYLDAVLAGPALIPCEARGAARMTQVVSIADSYAYWPLVRQVFAHGVWRPKNGEPADPETVSQGLLAAGPVLDVLEAVASEGLVLGRSDPTLADLHLAPMVAAFAQHPAGRDALGVRPGLAAWLQRTIARDSWTASAPSTWPA